MARVRIQPVEPTTDDDLHDLKFAVFYAVGKLVYNKGPKKLMDEDVSVFPEPVNGKAISGFAIEITVQLASDNWLKTKKQYNRLAKRIGKRIAHTIKATDRFNVWVVYGPQTGYYTGRGLLVSQ